MRGSWSMNTNSSPIKNKYKGPSLGPSRDVASSQSTELVFLWPSLQCLVSVVLGSGPTRWGHYCWSPLYMEAESPAWVMGENLQNLCRFKDLCSILYAFLACTRGKLRGPRRVMERWGHSLKSAHQECWEHYHQPSYKAWQHGLCLPYTSFACANTSMIYLPKSVPRRPPYIQAPLPRGGSTAGTDLCTATVTTAIIFGFLMSPAHPHGMAETEITLLRSLWSRLAYQATSARWAWKNT